MSPLLLPLLLLVGLGLSLRLVPDATLTERVAWALLGTLAGVPLVAMQLALATGHYVDFGRVVGLALLFLLGLGLGWRGLAAGWRGTRVRAEDGVFLVVAAVAGGLIAAHHHHADFLIGVASYLGQGETECFYMQSFELFAPLNEGVDRIPVDTVYGIASTPGNTLFTSSLLPALGVGTFRVLHACFAALLVLFVQAILRRWAVPVAVVAVAGLWAALNPWFLFVEVLDRNVIALALSAALVHALLFEPKRHGLHGLLFGLAAGAGLRFLGLTWILPVVLLKAPHRPGRGWLVFGAAFLFAFAFNLPHLQHHGFHALGETEPLWTLALAALEGSRTPFLPLPTGPYYLVHALASLGVIGAALGLAGAFEGWRSRRRETLALVLMGLLPLLLVATQRDWVQVDKTRIGLAGSLFVPLATGLALAALEERRWRSMFVALGLCLALPPLLGSVRGSLDASSYTRHPVFQRETPAWAEHASREFARVTLWPGYARLWRKLDWPRKRAEERVVAQRLFPPRTGIAGRSTALPRWLFGAERRGLPSVDLSEDFVDLRIDLSMLLSAPEEAVSLDGERPLLDLSAPDTVLDIHFEQARVPWQAEALGVAVLPGGPERGALGELYVDLNAFTDFGRDDLGFHRIDLVHHTMQAGGAERARREGMTALPWGEEDGVVDLRVPKDLQVILRWWLVDGWTGLPHRVEAWSIEGVQEGRPRAVWHPLEPESYL